MTPNGCQTSGGQETPFWADRKYADDLDQIYQHVLNAPEGIPLATLVKSTYSSADVSSSSAAYQRVRRFVQEAVERDLFKTNKRDGLSWVEPKLEAFRSPSLDTASKQSAKHEDDNGVALSNAQKMLQRRKTFDDPEERGNLLGAFAAKREAIEDRFHAFEDTFDPGEYILVPYTTRFSSTRRVEEIRSRYRGAWERAAAEYDQGIVLTLTTDPSKYDDLYEATTELLEDVNRLKSWLAQSPANGPDRPGYRPPNIVVPEFTADGKPHAHIAFFGLSWLTTHEALKTHWDQTRDRGRIVWFDRIHTRDGRWQWAGTASDRSHPDSVRQSPRSYLEDGVRLLADSAAVSAKELHAAANALRHGPSDRDDVCNEEAITDAQGLGENLWKAALYWATGLPIFTLSPELREPLDDETNPFSDTLPRYRYVGTAQYDEFPASIRAGATVYRERPPPQSGRPPPGKDPVDDAR